MITHTEDTTQLAELYGRMTGIVSPAQRRIDAWGALRRQADRLAAAARRGENTDELVEEVTAAMDALPYERFWVFPRPEVFASLRARLARGDYDLLAQNTSTIARLLGNYGDKAALLSLEEALAGDETGVCSCDRHYFTVLLVDDLPEGRFAQLRRALRALRRPNEDLVFELLVVRNVEDAASAVLFNHDIQACVIRSDLPLRSDRGFGEWQEWFGEYEQQEQEAEASAASQTGPSDGRPRGVVLGEWIRTVRPHLDLYLTTDQSATACKGADGIFNRTFYRYDSPSEIELTLTAGVRNRYETPFFDALQSYAAAPVGNFHALPIARGSSVFNSKWIQDMREFYGRNLFLAETSSTLGGLDSLLAPKGTIKRAKEKAAQTWGGDRTFFATNGTSTSNKIVVQALVRPGDIVLIDRNCHKSHHYGLVQNGAHAIYLDLYQLDEYGSYGAVSLSTIKKVLSDLRASRGEEEFQKMRIVLLLTNCTFDGINYDPTRVMHEVLAIKPNMCFLWDEAWFSFAAAVPQVRDRTAMPAARRLAELYASDHYRSHYERAQGTKEAFTLPDPELVRIRVYSTHSTHKSLSALRQGSMIHVFDQDYESETAAAFNEAFQMHTSTSPNYQIIASLDLARRQLDLEGYGMLTDVYQMAQTFRLRVKNDPRLAPYFKVLDQEDLIPDERHRPSGFKSYTNLADPKEQQAFNEAFKADEFMLDRTRCTLYVADVAFSGKEFQTEVLMGQHGIQVNKTSTNNVLFIFTIGVTWSSVELLLAALARTADAFKARYERASKEDRERIDRRIEELKVPLRQTTFSGFHSRFRPSDRTPEGDLREAYMMAYDETNRRRVALKSATPGMVSAAFVIPTPPGFPILVPGQLIGKDEIDYLDQVGIRELIVFKESALG